MTDDTAAAPASTPASDGKPRVTLLGTGVMGSGMSRSILRAGLPLTVWNRSADKAAPLADAGATVAETAADAVRDADVVVVMLFDADAVLEVLAEVAPALRPGAVVLQSSTVGVEGTRRIAALAAEHGVRLVDAPVLGTRGPAEQGLLVHLVSGSEDDIAVARPSSRRPARAPWSPGRTRGRDPPSSSRATRGSPPSPRRPASRSASRACSASSPGSSSTRSRAAPPTPRTRTSRAARCSPASSRRPSRSTACSRT